MEKQKNKEVNPEEKFFTLSEFRYKAGIPLVLAKKLIAWRKMKSETDAEGKIVVEETEARRIIKLLEKPWVKAYYFFKALGPGFVTGASDDDPGGIGTYSSVGAKFGLGIIWMAVWLLPMMMAIQEVCARIGIVTNKGLAGVLQKHYKRNIVLSIVTLLIVANVVNIGADLGAMAASLEMLVNVNFYVGAIFFALLSIVLEIFVGYHYYMRILKWLALFVLAYVATGLIINPEWHEVFRAALIPKLNFSDEYIFAVIAVFGTSITPYLFFWQTSGEVEDNNLTRKLQRLVGEKVSCKRHDRIVKMRTDVGTGMILANIVFFFIVLTTAQVLYKNGITEIESAHQAAEALRPLAGKHAYLLFAVGIIGTGLLAIPILAGSGAYALAEVMKWREGLDKKFSRAKGFYMVIVLSILVGLLLNIFNINPIMALYYSAFLNGIISLPLLITIMVVGGDREIMGREINPVWVRIFGWGAIFFMIGILFLGLVLFFN